MTNPNGKSKKWAKPRAALSKTIKLKKFDHLGNKPAQPKKGISYAVEKAENIDAKTGKRMDGDIFKKYENGVLKRQLFVPKASVKKLVQKSIQRLKTKTGGLFGFGKKKTPRVTYIQAPAKAPVQAPVQAAPVQAAPVQAAPAQQVVVQDGTTFGQALKTGVATGIGWGLAQGFIGALFGDN